MNSKLKISLFIVLLFAGLFVIIAGEAPLIARFGRQLAILSIFGFLIYCAVVLFRYSKRLDSSAGSTDERCGDDCGCQKTRTQPPTKQQQKVSK